MFCGSSLGVRNIYRDAAVKVGTTLARQGIGLVYGGSNVGLMGAMADAALAAGGEVTGVIPEALVAKEVAHPGLTDLRVVGSMHERKALMVDLSDAFIAMPGGYGTFDELCEALSWSQLGIHGKPCGVLNVNGYFDHFLLFLRHAVNERFLRPEHRRLLLAETDVERLVSALGQHQAPPVEKWIGRAGA